MLFVVGCGTVSGWNPRGHCSTGSKKPNQTKPNHTRSQEIVCTQATNLRIPRYMSIQKLAVKSCYFTRSMSLISTRVNKFMGPRGSNPLIFFYFFLCLGLPAPREGELGEKEDGHTLLLLLLLSIFKRLYSPNSFFVSLFVREVWTKIMAD